MSLSGSRKRLRDVFSDEGINTKHLKLYFDKISLPNSKHSNKEHQSEHQSEHNNYPNKECNCSLNSIKIEELNKKFDSMILLQSKLIALLEDIDYRFNDKGQMLSYIS